MRDNSVKRLAMNGLMIALVFLATYFTRIPTPLPGGYFNLGDAVIMLASAFLGPIGGLAAGGIGSAFADLAAGAWIYAPITLVVKGIEGLVVGILAANYMKSNSNKPNDARSNLKLIVALAAGAVIIVAGYFSGEAFVLSLFDNAFGIVAAAGELVPNFIQGGLSAILAYFLILVLSRVGIQKVIG